MYGSWYVPFIVLYHPSTTPSAILLNGDRVVGMFAIRDDRDYVVQDDFMKAVRKVADAKKLEGKMDCEYFLEFLCFVLEQVLNFLCR